MQNDVNAGMNWFERHLNWTALGMGVGSILLSTFFLVFSLGLNTISYYSIFELNSLLLILLSSVFVILVLLTVIGYGWILYKKNRSPAFSLFFLPVLITLIAGLIVQPTYSRYEMLLPFNAGLRVDYFDWHPFLPNIITANILVLFIGWVVLFSLKNCNLAFITESSDTAVDSETRARFFLRFYKKSKSVVISTVSLFCMLLFLSLFSFFFAKFGHVTYLSLNATGERTAPTFSFEYPASYTKPVFYNSGLFDGHARLIPESYFLLDAFYSGPSPMMSVDYFDENTSNNLKSKYGTDENGYPNYLLFKNFSNNDNSAIHDDIIVSGIPAHQITVTSKESYGTLQHFTYESTIVCFVRDNCFWVLTWFEWVKPMPNPNPAFTHLLETFKIYDE